MANNSFFRLLTYIGEAPTAFMPSRHDRQATFANLLAVIDPGHDGTDWVAVANTGAYNFAGTSTSLLQNGEASAVLMNQAAQDLAACGVGP